MTTKQPYQHSIKNLPTWNKALLVLAGLAMLAGAVLWAARAAGGQGPATQRSTQSGQVGPMGAGSSGLVDPQTGRNKPLAGGGGQQDAVAADDWSPALFKLGGSFLIGFCMGYALRTFFKMSIVALGVVFLALFALNYYAKEPIINWTAVSGLMEQLMAKVQSELGGFKTFVEGSLPSASLAALGLFTGFKKR